MIIRAFVAATLVVVGMSVQVAGAQYDPYPSGQIGWIPGYQCYSAPQVTSGCGVTSQIAICDLIHGDCTYCSGTVHVGRICGRAPAGWECHFVGNVLCGIKKYAVCVEESPGNWGCKFGTPADPEEDCYVWECDDNRNPSDD